MGALTESVLGANARSLFMIVMFLVLLMVNAAFATVIAGLLIKFPSAVIPVWGAIVVALGIGQLIYRFNVPLLWPSIIGVVLLYSLILVGDAVPIALPETVFGMSDKIAWVLILFVYAGVASVLPVWMLLQPRDYINGLQLFLALGIIYLATFIASPEIVAPMYNTNVPEGTPSVIPLLFVTIACGAVSGFHGLVASGTTSKQLNKETDARFVGYFGAVGEGLLALAAIICTTAGFASLEAWEETYASFGDGSVGAFVEGGASIVSAGLGLPEALAATILTVTAALFAGTTMDTGVRLQRYVIQEAGDIAGIGIVKNSNLLATIIALVSCFAIAFGAGADGSGGMAIWPLFGTSNQLLAGLTLCVITIMLMKRGRPTLFTLIPLTFLLAMTVLALLLQLGDFWTEGNWVLLVLDLIILTAAIMVILKAVKALKAGPQEDTSTIAAE
jgi:carbon starvation protein